MSVNNALCPSTVNALLSPNSSCSLPVHLSLTLPLILILTLIIFPRLPFIRDSPYRPREFCPEPVLPEWKREKTTAGWRALWRVFCVGEVGLWAVSVGIIVHKLIAGAEKGMRGGMIVGLVHVVGMLTTWTVNLLLPPRHIIPTKLTLFITLPLVISPITTLIRSLHYAYAHSLPLWPLYPSVFPNGWSAIGLCLDLALTGAIGVMVLGMRVGESEEEPVPWELERKKARTGSEGRALLAGMTCGLLGSDSVEDADRIGKSADESKLIDGASSNANAGETYGSSSSETDSLLHGSARSPSAGNGIYGSLTTSPENELGHDHSTSDPQSSQTKHKAYWNDLGYQGPSPEMTTTIWSSLRLGWMEDLFRVGFKKDLNENDVWAMSPGFRTKALSEAWGRLKGKSVYRKLWEANSYDLTIVAVYAWLATAAKYTAPYTLKRILQSIENPTPANRADAYLYAFIALFATIAGAQLEALHGWHSRRAGSRSKTALVAEIYKKALRRRDMSGAPASKEDAEVTGKSKGKKDKDTFNADIGKIVNVISADANQVFQRLAGSAQILQAPVEIIISTVFLYQVLGYSAFAGLVVFVMVIPLNSWLGKRGIVYTRAVMSAADMRMKVMNELILGIKSIKLFGWQTRWQAKTRDAYQVEMQRLIRSRTNSLLYSAVWDLAPIAINLLAFASYLFIAKRELDVATAFTAIALLIMLHRPLGTLPRTFLEVLQARVSIDRIAAFLDEEEIPFAMSVAAHNAAVSDSGIELDHATLAWSSDRTLQLGTKIDQDRNSFRLRDITLKVAEGKVTVITGEVGSGKSALIIAMLGEMRLLEGHVHTPRSTRIVGGLKDSVAFCAQNPWIESGCLREIICFGSPMDQERYDQTLSACCLEEDIAMFEDGDMTEIGIRGLNLSGGTKARVALARAVYSRSRYLLLDDPWAAVDVIVGKRLLKNLLIDRILMEGRTVVVVTHHLDLLLTSNNIHSIVRMEEGEIARIETPEQVIEHGAGIGSPMQEALVAATGDRSLGVASKPAVRNHEFKKLVNAEERLFGSVRWGTYWLYIKACGAPVWIGILSTLVLQKGCTQFQRYWLKCWGEAYSFQAYSSLNMLSDLGGESEHTIPGTSIPLPPASSHPGYYLGVFAAIALGASLLNLAQQYIAYTGSVIAVSHMHDIMLDAVVSSPARFFDEQPAGRILNRFSNDLRLIAGQLGTTLKSVLGLFGAALANYITLVVIEPRVSVICVLVLLVYYTITQVYLRSARDLRRIISIARSPLFTSFGELIDGILTVRAFAAERRLIEEMYKTVDWMQSSVYLWQGCNRWLVLNFNTLGALVIFVVTMLVLTGSRPSAGSAGIAIVTARAFVDNVLWIARDWTNLEQAFNAVERVEEYLANPREPPARILLTTPPPSWPAPDSDDGCEKPDFLVVSGLRVRYAHDLPDVVKGLSFAMKARERLAVVGRTGSGKSTLAMSLLRFCEPSAGKVVLDGIDISTIGLEDLRLRVNYLPQDPNLFSGTLRTSLDPFDEYEDAILLEALDKAQLRSSAREDQQVDLDSEVVAGGTNWSQGQRQLICLARSIVRQSTLIISDEATSSIDPATDALVQAVIAENFKDTAFVTIAHRLMSIIHFDKVLVMANGELAEMGDPWDLLQRDGVFRNMVSESGQEAELRAAAQAAWETRQTVV